MKELPIVSFETAKLLKDVGFDWETVAFYGLRLAVEGDLIYSNLHEKDAIFAPTQALAQMWLEEVHYIHINIRYEDFIVEDDNDINCTFWVEGFPMEIRHKPKRLESNVIFEEEDCLIDGYYPATRKKALEYGIQKACEYLISQLKTK